MTNHNRADKHGRQLWTLLVLVAVIGVAAGVTVIAVVGRTTARPKRAPARTNTTATTAQNSSGNSNEPCLGASPEESCLSGHREKTQAKQNEAAPLTSGEGSLKRLVGPVTIAVDRNGRPPEVVGEEGAEAHGWSTMKIPVIATYLNAVPVPPPAIKEAIRLAITESNNAAVLEVWSELERIYHGEAGASRELERTLDEHQKSATHVYTGEIPSGAATTFGQTDWRAGPASEFFLQLADHKVISSDVNTNYVLKLMSEIAPSQRWGVGAEGANIAGAAYKDGWGPEGAKYLVRQSAIIDAGTNHATTIAIIAYPPPGAASFAEGQRMVSEAANWVKKQLHL